jgi:hypothetical protein
LGVPNNLGLGLGPATRNLFVHGCTSRGHAEAKSVQKRSLSDTIFPPKALRKICKRFAVRFAIKDVQYSASLRKDPLAAIKYAGAAAENDRTARRIKIDNKNKKCTTYASLREDILHLNTGSRDANQNRRQRWMNLFGKNRQAQSPSQSFCLLHFGNIVHGVLIHTDTIMCAKY